MRLGDIMRFIKKSKYCLLSFFIPILVFFIFLIVKGILTKYSFTISDSHSQYLSTYKYLYDVLHGNASFPYTFSKGLGGSMYGALFYGFSSPINLLIYFFKDIELFMMISTLLKIGLSGLTSFLLFCKNNNNSKYNLVFSLSYSLSGYILLYYSNIMWLDSVWLAPLVLLGINKLINEKKNYLYIISLLTCLISNYYTGYMVVIFSLIYFFYELYIKYNGKNFLKENKIIIRHFLIITFLIGMAISFILIPILFESANFQRVNKEKLINLNYLDLFVGSYIGFGKINNPLNYSGFLSYCGTLIPLLIINYFINKNISRKEKKATFVILLIFLGPVFIKPLSYIWHLFTYPQGFNYRYSFLFILFTLLIGLKSFNNLCNTIKPIKIFIMFYFIISASLLYTSTKNPNYYIYINHYNIILTLILFIINYLLINKKKRNILITLLSLEVIINITIIFCNSSFISYKVYDKYTNFINKQISSIDKNYRYENNTELTLNDPLYFNYKGTSSFLSSTNKHYMLFINKLTNIEKKSNFISYKHTDIISDSLLGLKYISDTVNNSYYNLINTYSIDDKKIYLLENPYVLSLGYTVSKEIKNYNNDKKKNLEKLNYILNLMNNDKENYFTELNVIRINNKEYQIDLKKDTGQLYILSDYPPINIKNIYSSNNYGIIYPEKNKITLKFDKKMKDIKVYTLDLNKFKKFIKNRNQITKLENNNNNIKAQISVNKDNVLLLTIPYEKGWKICIDGKETKYYKVLDSVIGVDITKGEHNIELYYEIPGLNVGITISSLSLVILIAYLLRTKK